MLSYFCLQVYIKRTLNILEESFLTLNTENLLSSFSPFRVRAFLSVTPFLFSLRCSPTPCDCFCPGGFEVTPAICINFIFCFGVVFLWHPRRKLRRVIFFFYCNCRPLFQSHLLECEILICGIIQMPHFVQIVVKIFVIVKSEKKFANCCVFE